MDIFERRESEVRGYCRLYPAVFDKAENALQFDEDGNRYIDFFAGAGVLNFGHNPPAMKEALIDYLSANGVAHSLDMSTTAKRTFLSAFENIILTPRSLDYKVQFTGPTGTNSVEAALKLARKVTGRRQVVAFTHAYHGMTLGALAVTGNAKFRNAAGVPLDGVIRLPFDGYAGAGDTSLHALREALADSSSGMEPPAAFIVETVQAEGGVNVASGEWLRAVQALAREHDSLFIVDDIQVGCGRTGTYFSFEDMGLDPDLVCMAKGIGGFGLAMAVLLIKPEYDQWSPGEHTGTFRGQNLAFVAGARALDYFRDDKLLREVRDKGGRMHERLAAIMKEHGRGRWTVRGRGMIQSLDTGDGQVAAAVLRRAFERGLLIGTCGTDGRVLKVMPPLTIEDGVLDEGLDILRAALAGEAADA
jgi:diaminobutyrate-2-oxoglutarate transaminase